MIVDEEKFYEIAALEIAERRPVLGLMAKAFSEADGDEKRAAAKYLGLRVRQLIREQSEILEKAKREPRDHAAMEEAKLMKALGITHNGKYYEVGEWHFDKIEEAIDFVRELKILQKP